TGCRVTWGDLRPFPRSGADGISFRQSRQRTGTGNLPALVRWPPYRRHGVSTMYDSDDPRSRLSTAEQAGEQAAARAFGVSTYARYYDSAPQEAGPSHRTWYTRGQNFVVCYSQAEEGAVLERTAQADEYVLLLPDHDSAVRLEANGEVQEIGGFTIT